jgi:hypothetical protein
MTTLSNGATRSSASTGEVSDERSPLSPANLWAGRVLSGLAAALLLFSGSIKLVKLPPVIETFAQLGIPDHLARGIGLIELGCTIIYLIPRTAVLGAILLTAIFGGAIISHLRVGNPLGSHVLFPIYVGLFIWGGLFLRDRRLRAMLPLRR